MRLNKMKKAVSVLLALVIPGCMFGERLVFKKACEVTGKNINVRIEPNGEVIGKVSAPGIVISGSHEDGDLGGPEWTPLVNISGYEEGYVSSKFVKPVPYRKFDSSYCGSYFVEGQDGMVEDYSYSLATIEKKPHGWYVMTVTDYSQPQGPMGLRSRFTRVLAGKTFQSMEVNPAERMNDFDGIMFMAELLNPSDLDNIKAGEYPANVLGDVEGEYLIVTGAGELMSPGRKFTKD